jgi:RIO kinase 1
MGWMRVMWQVCRLVHADLSEYNILYHDKRLHIIDVSQSVEHDHPRSLEFLRMDVKNVTAVFERKGVKTLSERRVFGFVIDAKGSTEMDGMQRELERLFEKQAEVGEDEVEQDDEVWRQQYIPRNLREVADIERDGDKIKEGKEDELVYQDLLAGSNKNVTEGNDSLAADGKDGTLTEANVNGEDDDVDSEDDDGDNDDFSDDGEKKPRGKRFEDKDAKREHKRLVKEEKRERRTQKMPKHVKKKLVNQSSRGKK